MDNFTRVEGKNMGKIMIFTLSTCIWCRKTKNFLQDLGVEYFYVDMDELSDELETTYKEELKKWNPLSSYPTIVINDSACIVGFNEDKIRKELGI
jgi:glutaredoxin-like protein NrdH